MQKVKEFFIKYNTKSKVFSNINASATEWTKNLDSLGYNKEPWYDINDKTWEHNAGNVLYDQDGSNLLGCFFNPLRVLALLLGYGNEDTTKNYTKILDSYIKILNLDKSEWTAEIKRPEDNETRDFKNEDTDIVNTSGKIKFYKNKNLKFTLGIRLQSFIY